jgi:ABC-type transport system substrate-binding protein
MRALTRQRRRGSLVTIVGAATALIIAVAGCSGSGSKSSSSDSSAPKGKGGGSLTIGDPVALTSSDPIKAASSRDQSYLWTVYDTLINFDPKTMEPTPGLALSWTTPDPLSLVLKLRDGVTFQDGTPFNADAVKFNFDRTMAAGTTTVGLLGSITSVTATDASTVTLKLKQPDSSLLLAFTDLAGMMVSPTAAKASATSLATTPVGTGPYQFVSQAVGSGFIVTRYANYWDKNYIGPTKIEFKVLPDPATEANALKSGQINLAINVDASQVDGLKATADIKTQSSPSFENIPILFNLKRAPLDNIKVRQAVNLAVDRKALVSKAEFGFATESVSILPKESWAYPSALSVPTRDVAGAKKLLTDAGFPNGVKFDIIVQPTAVYQRIATLLQAQLAEAGITLNIIPLDLATNTTAFLTEGKYDSELASFGGRQDPATAYAALYSTTGFLNPQKSVIPGIDAAVAAANSKTTVADRKPALQDLGKIAYDQAVSTVLYQRQLIVSYNKSVTGYTPNILGKPKFNGITVS